MNNPTWVACRRGKCNFCVPAVSLNDLFDTLVGMGYARPTGPVQGLDRNKRQWVNIGPGIPFQNFLRVILAPSVDFPPPEPLVIPAHIIARSAVAALSVRGSQQLTNNLNVILLQK